MCFANDAIRESRIAFFWDGAFGFCNAYLVVCVSDADAQCTTLARAANRGHDIEYRTTAYDRSAFNGNRAYRIFQQDFSACRSRLFTVNDPFDDVVNRRRGLANDNAQEDKRAADRGFHFFRHFLIRREIGRFIWFVEFTALRYYFFVGRSLTRRIRNSFCRNDSNAFAIANLRRPWFAFLCNGFRVLRITVIIFRFNLRNVRFFMSFQRDFFREKVFNCTFFFEGAYAFYPALEASFYSLLQNASANCGVFALYISRVFTVGRVLAIAYIAERTGANDQDVARIARCRNLCTCDDAPFNEGAFRFTMGGNTFIRPTTRCDAGNAPGLFMYANQGVLSNLFFCDGFGTFGRFFGIFRFRFIIRLRAFFFLCFFSGFLREVSIFLIRQFRARCRIAVRLCRAAMEVPYRAKTSNLTTRTFRRFIVWAWVGSNVRRAQREDTNAQACEGRWQILCVSGLKVRRVFSINSDFLGVHFRRFCCFVFAWLVVFTAGFYNSYGSQECKGAS